jgi:uncharacterized protein (TIGR00369 family)
MAGSGIPLHDLLGFEFEAPPLGEGWAEVRLPVAGAALGVGPNLHGGAIATLIDLASALCAACNTDFDMATQSLVTSDLHIRYLGRARTDVVVARAELVRAGKQLIVVETKVRDTDGHLVASADFSAMIVSSRATPVDRAEATVL